jgi:hypothetical protein
MVATVSNLVNLSLDPDGLLHEQGMRFSEVSRNSSDYFHTC